MKLMTFLIFLSDFSIVLILVLNGFCLTVLTEISPKFASNIVLGIGVADINNISTFLPLFLILILWFTPNLCCSSMIT